MASLASSGTSFFRSALAASCSANAARVRRYTADRSAQALDVDIAELDLARVRQVRADLIARASALGSLTPQRFFRTKKDELRWLVAQDYLKVLARRNQRPSIPLLPPPEPINPAAPMPAEISERLAEAVKRLLPELRSTYSYEQRAAARRDRAIREISRHTMRLSQLSPKF